MNLSSFLIKEANIVCSEGIRICDVRISDNKFSAIAAQIVPEANETIIDAKGKYLFPGLIDTHVHFREPGLSYKATWATESAAAVAGGVTTVFDMPNTDPPTLSPALVQEKLALAKANSLCNYGVFLGVSASNLALLADYDLSDKRFQVPINCWQIIRRPLNKFGSKPIALLPYTVRIQQ